MQMQGAHLDRGHSVQLLQDKILVPKVPGDVQHQSPVAEPWIVQNDASRQDGILIHHHPKACLRAINTSFGNGENIYALLSYSQLISLIPGKLRNIQRIDFLEETLVAKMDTHVTAIHLWEIFLHEYLVLDRNRNDVLWPRSGECRRHDGHQRRKHYKFLFHKLIDVSRTTCQSRHF